MNWTIGLVLLLFVEVARACRCHNSDEIPVPHLRLPLPELILSKIPKILSGDNSEVSFTRSAPSTDNKSEIRDHPSSQDTLYSGESLVNRYHIVDVPSPIGIINPALPLIPENAGVKLVNHPLILDAADHVQNAVHDVPNEAYQLQPNPSSPAVEESDKSEVSSIIPEPFPMPRQLLCVKHALVPVPVQVVDECVVNVPIVKKTLRHKEEMITKHIPIIHNTVTEQREKIVRHLPFSYKALRHVTEYRTRHVPVIRARTRTIVEPYTEHVAILEHYSRPVEDSYTKEVPISETRLRPVVSERTRLVPISEKRLVPVVEMKVDTVPVKRQYVRTLIEHVVQPVRRPCQPCYWRGPEFERAGVSEASVGSRESSMSASSSVNNLYNSQLLEDSIVSLVPTGDYPSMMKDARHGNEEDRSLEYSTRDSDSDYHSSIRSSNCVCPLGDLTNTDSALAGATLGPADIALPYTTGAPQTNADCI